MPVDYVQVIGSALTAIDELISLINHIKGQSALTTEAIAASAEAQDLKNLDDIKALLDL